MKNFDLRNVFRALLVSLSVFLLPYVVCSQTQYQVNGRVLVKVDGHYYDVTYPDSLKVVEHCITVKFKKGQKTTGATNLIQTYNLKLPQEPLNDYYDFELPEDADVISMTNSLLSEGTVDKVYLNHYIPFCWTFPNDPGSSSQSLNIFSLWYYDLLNIIDVWDITTGNPAIKVAIIDAGCDWDDADLIDPGISYDLVHQTTNVTPGFHPCHGTEMTSIIAARTNNNTEICGIAGGWGNTPGVSVMMVKISDSDEIESQYSDDAVLYAATHGAHIINMSWGNYNWFYQPLDDEINNAYAMGVTMFASVGNTDNVETNDPVYDLICWPASHEHVIAVGGTNQYDERWVNSGGAGSSFNGQTEISTVSGGTENDPLGMFVISNTNNILYDQWMTSGASATASAIAGLMLSVNPCLTPDEIREILIQSCVKLGGYNYNWNPQKPGHSKELGYGRVDALTAVNLSNPLPGFTVNNNDEIVWDKPKFVNGNITIHAGGKLIINSVLKMSSGNKIIIEEGGALELDGATLTSRCEAPWAGIEVHGNPALPQTSADYQGRLSIYNSIIENAQVAIGVCDDLSAISISGFVSVGGGGIIEASQANIINCTIGVTFAPYEYGNISYFKRGSIVYNSNALTNSFAGGMFFNSINDISLIGTQFQNLTTSPIGYGIRSYNSSFSLDYFCDDIEAPCQTGFGIKCLFENLNYGVYAENIGTNKFVNIKNSKFDGNNQGFYGSGLLLPALLDNIFISPNEATISYGMYLNVCNQYTVENNTFISSSSTSSPDIGLYIYNSGGQENQIYNNEFRNLMYGAVAYGINRNYTAGTGLCFKCNDFIGCDYDISVPEPIVLPVSLNHGIRKTQGSIGTLNTDAAGNTFSLNGINNFFNQVNKIQYVAHGNANPQSAKIIPNPRSSSVSITLNTNTYYTKQISCPRHDFAESMQELVEEQSNAEQLILSTETQLESFVDGGNTQNLNGEIESADPSQSLDIYQNLLTISPYLSDEVMKTGIEKTDVLVDAMIRDILVANPSAAKSEDVMQKLSERPIPLTEEMVDEILSGENVLSSKDVLAMNLVKANESWSNANRGIMLYYSQDTVPMHRNDSILELLSSSNNFYSRIQYALINGDLGNANIADQTLENIPVDFVLDENSNAELTAIQSLLSEINLLKPQDENYITSEGLASSNLVQLSQNDELSSGAFARNILHAAGIIEYNEPIILVNENKSDIAVVSNSIQPIAKTSNLLEVFPNPASQYCIVRYQLPESSKSGIITLIDPSGKMLLIRRLTDTKNSIVFPLENIPAGSYRISLIIDGVLQKSLQLNVLL